MKYKVVKDCSWKDWFAKPGQTLTTADLVTGDGSPLPPEVIEVCVSRGCLVPVKE